MLQREPYDATKTLSATTKTPTESNFKKSHTIAKKKKKIQVTRLKNGQRHTNDQEVDKKLLNNTRNQGNANQNQNEVSPHTCYNTYYLSVGKEVEKREPSCTVDWNVNWCSPYGKQRESSSKN